MFLSFSFYSPSPLFLFTSLIPFSFRVFSFRNPEVKERETGVVQYVQFRTVHFISKVNSVEIKSSGYGIETPGNRVGWIDTSSIGAYYIFTRTRR